MARHRLSPDEARLWGRVAATVRPLGGRLVPDPAFLSEVEGLVRAKPRTLPTAPKHLDFARCSPSTSLGKSEKGPINNTLDATWDKRLLGGRAQPDRTIDLHGHTAASAHTVLDRALGDAIRSGARLVLLVTGRPARDNPRMPPTGRGVIRASVEDWLMAGPHSAKIAAIRNAHPRHGGAGALYLVLRRDRTG